MKKQLLRLAVPVIIAICFLNLSCKKDSGILADYDSTEPYYKDFVFEDEWGNDLSWLDFPEQTFRPSLQLANENLLISFDYLKGIFAIEAKNGEILWHTPLEANDEIAFDSELLIIDNLMVFYDRQGMTTANLLTGQFINRISYSLIGDVRGSTRAFTSHDRNILLMTIETHPTSGTQRLYKINPTTMEAELLAEVETSVVYNEMSYIFVDTGDNKAFFLHGKTSTIEPILMLSQVNLDDNSFINHELGVIENLGRFSVSKSFSVLQNIAFLSFQHSDGMVAYDLELEDTVGIIYGSDDIKAYGSHFLTLSPKLMLLNRENLQNEWNNDYFYFADVNEFDLVEDNQILVVLHRSNASLRDMTDGQLLVSHRLAPENQKYYNSNTVVSRKHNLIYKAGYDQENGYGFIQCIRSPIDLDL